MFLSTDTKQTAHVQRSDDFEMTDTVAAKFSHDSQWKQTAI